MTYMINLAYNLLVRHCANKFTDLSVTKNGRLVGKFADGSAVYLMVAHLGDYTDNPTWPAVVAESQTITIPDAVGEPMRADEFCNLLHSLLAHDDRVYRVASLVTAGATGSRWPPHGLRIRLTNGVSGYLAVVRTSADERTAR